MRRLTAVGAAAVALGGALGVASTSWHGQHAGEPFVVRGLVKAVPPTHDAVAVRFDDLTYPTPDDGGSVRVVARLPWRDASGDEFEGGWPTCLGPDAYDRALEFVVVDPAGVQGDRIVVGVHCPA